MYEVDGEHFVMTIPAGKTHDLWKNNRDAGRLVQAVTNGDFDIEVKFYTLPDPLLRNQIQGIVVEESADKFLRFDVSSDGSAVKIGSYLINDSTATSPGGTTIIDTSSGYEAFYLRLSRTSNNWKARYSFDNDEWNSFANFSQVLSVTGVGVHAGNAGDNPEFTSIVDYFFNRIAPIEPEDEIANTLPDPHIIGNGGVGKFPDCGAPVTLTAIPGAADWRFAGWSGSLSGTDNPKTLNTLNGGESITATFKLARQLTVVVNGPGAVDKSPDQVEYLDGDTVDLTALPGKDAAFLGWSGDLTGTEPGQSLTMETNKIVTATFATVYNLELDTIGNGTVTATPSQSDGLAEGMYFENSSLTLTPVAAENWRFAGWEGDLTGADDPATTVIDGNKSITARFIEVRKLTVNQAGKGAGSIDISPPSIDGYYEKGSIITLQAIASDKALFDGWSGDVTSTSTSIQILLDEDKAVTATFLGFFTVSTAVNGQGTITVNPVKAQYVEGETATFQAFPTNDWVFVGWTGIPGSSNPVTVEINADLDVVAVFTENPTTLTHTVVGQGSVVATPDRMLFATNETVTLWAVAEQGWKFAGWVGNLPTTVDSSSSQIDVLMDVDRTVTAVFEREMQKVYLPMVTK